jgi:alkylhydroperoxidase/carboxymuconolactone decarboxylase family protein YurZ
VASAVSADTLQKTAQPGAFRPGGVAGLAEAAGASGKAFKGFIESLYADTTLDPKVRELVFLGVQTALGLEIAVRAHLPRAVQAGATRAEIIAAMMLAIPNGGATGAIRCVPLVDEVLPPGQ